MNSNPQIMIIDDMRDYVEIISEYLEKKFHNTTITGTDCAYIGLQRIIKEKPDIILLDHAMPNLDGSEIMKKLRNIYSSNTYNPRTILISNIEKEEIEKTGKIFDCYIKKPLDVCDLFSEIYKVVNFYLNQLYENSTQNTLKKIKFASYHDVVFFKRLIRAILFEDYKNNFYNITTKKLNQNIDFINRNVYKLKKINNEDGSNMKFIDDIINEIRGEK